MAFFNACLASGGVIALETGEAAAMVSLSTALEDGEDDPLNQFLAAQAANLSSSQAGMQVSVQLALLQHWPSVKTHILKAVAALAGHCPFIVSHP